MEWDQTEQERVDLMSRREQDQAFQRALLRAVRLGREQVTACPAPAASTKSSDAQTPPAATAAPRGGRWSDL